MPFNIVKWKAELPRGKGPRGNRPFLPNDPSLDLDSIKTRPLRYLTPEMGPGAVVYYDSMGNRLPNGPGIRGSIEGPPFVGTMYYMSSDKMNDEKEGTTDKGRWMCVSKKHNFTTMASLDGTHGQTIGKHDSNGYHEPGWFEYPYLQDYIFTEMVTGGRLSRKTRTKRSKTRKSRR